MVGIPLHAHSFSPSLFEYFNESIKNSRGIARSKIKLQINNLLLTNILDRDNFFVGNIRIFKMKSETKRECFVRLAELRTHKVLEALRILGHCSNKSTYEYTNKDIKKIFDTINQEVQNTKKRFIKTDAPKGNFTLR